MSELANQQLIEQLLHKLRAAGVALDYRQLAEVLWLARYHPDANLQPAGRTWETRVTSFNQQPDSEPLYMPSSTMAYSEHIAGKPVRVPAVPVLPRALEISRALRPFSRRQKSKRLFVLDEEETAEQAARHQLNFLLPFQRPAPERWFDLALVVEDTPSLSVWKQTISEFARLLERQGAFRDVRQWQLRFEEQQAHLIAPSGAQRLPGVLKDPTGRRLVVMASDCVSRHWYDGSLARVLVEWGKVMPVAIVHLLNQQLWNYTATGNPIATVKTTTPGVPNWLLTVRHLPWWEAPIGKSPPFPMISLEPELIALWARMVMAAGVEYQAVMLSPLPPDVDNRMPPERASEMTADERIIHFKMLSSTEAYKLAVFLSFMPLTLPVIRLVHQAIIEHPAQEQLAELLYGGIILRITPLEDKRPADEVEYDFYPGVRETLQRSVERHELGRVFSSISNLIGRRIVSAAEFVVWVRDASGERDQAELEILRFAEIIPTLKTFGLGHKGTQPLRSLVPIAKESSSESAMPSAPSMAPAENSYIDSYEARHLLMPRWARSLARLGSTPKSDVSETACDLHAKMDPKPTCHFRAEMDQEVVVKRQTTVAVIVSREVIVSATSAVATSGWAEVDAEKKILLQVIPKRNFKSVGKDRFEIDLPPFDKPQQLYFDLLPTNLGDGEVLVVARQGQVPLVTLKLKTQIVNNKTKTGMAGKARDDKAVAAPPPLAAPLHQLWVREQINGNQTTLSFELYSEGLKLREWESLVPFRGSRQQYVEDVYKDIENRWLSHCDDFDNFTSELRAYGGEMFDLLIPPKLQQVLWQHRNQIDSIQVISEEPFIPWELIHLKEAGKRALPDETRFLGQMGLMRWLHQAGWPPDTLKIRKGRARYVIPNYPHPDYELPEAAKEYKFLEQKFSATRVVAMSGEVRKLISQPGGFDLLHFAGHGSADQNNITHANLLMEGRIEGQNYIPDYFSATIASQFSSLATPENRPLIVLNACQAGRAGYKLTGVGGFAEAFLMGGAGAFVGTLWSVGDSPARSFTEELYTQLLIGETLAKSAIKAREKARQAGDATWLAYTVYGHPHLQLTNMADNDLFS
jgi:hypothetical protein